MNSLQFLTDEEYEAVRRDITTIVHDLREPTFASNGATKQITLRFNTEEVIAKLTAYVDQKVKRYY